MTVFKTYFKILKKGALLSILINLAVAVGIFTIFKMQSYTDVRQYKVNKPNITIYDEDNSEFSKVFKAFLDKNANIVDIENKENMRLKALFYRKTNCIVTIPKGYGEKVKNGQILNIDVQSFEGLEGSKYAEILINKYLKTFDIYNRATDLSVLEISNMVDETLSNQIEVTIKNSILSQYTKKTLFYNAANYVIMTLLITCIAIISSSFNNRDIRRRINSSTLSLSSINLQIVLGHLVVTLATLGIILILGKIMFSINFTSTEDALHIINIFIFSITTLCLAYLISNVVTSMQAIHAISIVVSLGCCFLGGSFVPQDFLGESIKFTAVINPVYWYVKANNNISSVTLYTFESLKQIFISMTVEILFGIVFLCISMAIVKYKRTQN